VPVIILTLAFMFLPTYGLWFGLSPVVVFGLLILVFILPNLIMDEKTIEFKTRDESIWVYMNKRNAEEVNRFLESMNDSIKNYLVKKYGYYKTN
jgi:hypothetical protein